jgi:DNA-directed RNA polymerase subunit RPC12/RpoP
LLCLRRERGSYMTVPDRPEIPCAWCGGGIPLARFAASDDEEGTEVAVCPRCGRRVALQLPLGPS